MPSAEVVITIQHVIPSVAPKMIVKTCGKFKVDFSVKVDGQFYLISFTNFEIMTYVLTTYDATKANDWSSMTVTGKLLPKAYIKKQLCRYNADLQTLQVDALTFRNPQEAGARHVFFEYHLLQHILNNFYDEEKTITKISDAVTLNRCKPLHEQLSKFIKKIPSLNKINHRDRHSI